MDLESEVLNVRMKGDAIRIADWVGPDPRRFKQLMELFLHGEFRVTQQSAWIVGICFDRHPQLITPWLPAMIKRMQEPDLPDAVRRNVIRILQFVDVPKALLGTVVSLCFEYINSYSIPVAVRAFAMTVLANAAEREPALNHELKTSLALLLPAATGGILARARMVMRRLEKSEKQKAKFTKQKRT